MELGYTRQDVLDVIDQVGKSSHVFYCWLLQYDKLTEDYQALIRPVLGTQTWQRIFRLASQSPDDLDIKIVRLLASGQPLVEEISSGKSVVIPPPTKSSVWSEFYLADEAIYRATLQQLMTLVEQEMMMVSDDLIFAEEYRF